MVLNLQPAAALLALLSADALSLTAAERARREQFLTADNQKERRMASNFVLDKEFHRAMLSNSAGPAHNKRMLKKMNGGRGGRSTGDGAKKFAEQPRIRRLLANLRRKRALAGPVKRGVDASKLDEAPNDQAIVDAKLKEGPVEEEEVELLELAECSLNDADVGLLPTADATTGAGCDEGYACVPSDESALGGLCAPTATVARSLDEDVFYCPPGCPDAVCGCYEDPLATACTNALVDACRDGTYVQYCGPTDRLEQAYSQAYCDAYVCLGDNGLTDYVGGYDVCDTDDSRCTECYCTLYSSLCNIFTPICQNGSDAYVCYDIDYVCSMRDCCDQQGPDECIGDFGSYGSVEPTPSPTEPPSAATSDLLMTSGGRYAMLGATAMAAIGLAQSLF